MLLAAVRAAARPEDPAERRLWNGLRAFFEHTAEHPEGWAVLSRQARSYGEPFAGVVAELRESVVDFIVRLIEEAAGTESLDGCEASGLAYALVGAAESLADRAICPPGNAAPSAREAAATLMNVAWVGLENLVDGRRWGMARA
ncbi:hypothetical protein GCM10020221_36680 [Streptomyces thioluteus]|uniref:DesT tetracyclin repressor-like C-terminal domain-containing protein n=1 Tax=Streptomyces thioluteus TaxID=66431 RepID=A0ABP6JM98_STRTU